MPKSKFEMQSYKTSNGLYNLQIVDRDPDLKNFVYMGINEAVKNKIYSDYANPEMLYLHFRYDLGEVFVDKTTIHSLVFQEYESFDDMEYGPDPDAGEPDTSAAANIPEAVVLAPAVFEMSGCIEKTDEELAKSL
jgi:hypothetical protein